MISPIPDFHPPFIAHRGARAEAPENTLAAFMLARDAGATWLEFDVKITSDGVPMLMHDDTVDRTTDGKGNVADMNWSDIKALDAGSWFNARFKGERVPHLAEALRCVLDSGMQLNMEIKPCPGRAKATTMVTLIEASKWWPPDHPPPIVSSFSEEALAAAMQLQPQWPRSFAFEKWQDDWLDVARRIEAAALSIDADLLTPQRLPLLKASGLPILAFTVNDAARAKELLNQGVTAIFCDNPKELIKACE